MGTKEWSISDKELKSVIDESKKLKQINGYNNIHKIQSADLEVPLLISEYFDGTVGDFSKMLEKLEYKTQMKQTMHEWFFELSEILRNSPNT